MNPGRVANKIALVTGAGSGIGRATAVLLAQEGATVIVADIDMHASQEVGQQIVGSNGSAWAVQLDVASEAAWQAIIGKTVAAHHRLDILVNNAGVSISKPVAQSTFADWRKVLSVNLDGVFLVSSTPSTS